eukprot:COSAG03_NODE_5150_length_1330_cov_1.670187_3_plen_68_part_01
MAYVQPRWVALALDAQHFLQHSSAETRFLLLRNHLCGRWGVSKVPARVCVCVRSAARGHRREGLLHCR